MRTVQHLLDRKSSEVFTIEPGATVFDALVRMAQRGVGALLVMDRGELVGIFSERDYARKIILHGKASKETTVHDIMTREVLYVDPEYTIEECMALMTENTVRHLPVLVDGRVVGIVSIGDVVKALISDQSFIIDQLQQFIMGR